MFFQRKFPFLFQRVIFKIPLVVLLGEQRCIDRRGMDKKRKKRRDHQRENKASDLFKYTLVLEMVRKIRFDPVEDFKITLEFHSE